MNEEEEDDLEGGRWESRKKVAFWLKKSEKKEADIKSRVKKKVNSETSKFPNFAASRTKILHR